MRKKTIPFFVIAIMMVISACSNNEEQLLDNQPTFSFSAFIVDNQPTTRINLESNIDDDIVVRWEVGDVIDVSYVQNGVTRTGKATVVNTSSDRKKAIFGNVKLPVGIVPGVVDVYGVYGGGGIAYNTTNAILPANAGTAKSLPDLLNRKDVMLYFAAKNFNTNNASTASVDFKHLGSVFAITLRNTCKNPMTLNRAILEGVNNPNNKNWAYNTDTGGNTFNLSSQTFQNTQSAGNILSFSTNVTTLRPRGGKMTFLAWYPVLPNKVWPEVQLELIPGGKTRTTINTLPAQVAPLSLGKVYNVYAQWNGTNIRFTNELFQ